MKFAYQEHHLYQLLNGYEAQHLPLDLYINHYFRSHKALGSKDRRFIAETIYGMARWRGLLEYLLGPKAKWPQKVALYQGFQPLQYVSVNHIPLHHRVSFPKELFSLLLTQYGEQKAIEICQTSNDQAPITLRANPLKTTREALLKRLSSKYPMALASASPYGIVLKRRMNLFSLPEFKEGLFEVQDEASQLAALLLKGTPGDKVLDYCSGSGGKSLAFAHTLQNKGQIYLHDIRLSALMQAKKRLKRAGIQNAQLVHPASPLLRKLKKRMDWVFVDVPCTGTGTLRRNPDMKWKFSSALLHRLISEQRTIFERALSFLAPGGRIIYATCSLLEGENQQQIAHFKKTYNLEEDSPPFVSLPKPGGMDGFFATVLKRQSD